MGPFTPPWLPVWAQNQLFTKDLQDWEHPAHQERISHQADATSEKAHFLAPPNDIPLKPAHPACLWLPLVLTICRILKLKVMDSTSLCFQLMLQWGQINSYENAFPNVVFASCVLSASQISLRAPRAVQARPQGAGGDRCKHPERQCSLIPDE